jgi:hypothetical protein
MTTIGTAQHKRSEPDLLGIYLNDHFAGATMGVELARRAAKQHTGAIGDQLDRLAAEIAEDRRTFRQMMKTLGVPVRRYKVYGAWLAEKVARAKFNGYLTERSPLSTLIELEALRLGVEGKATGWRSLEAVAERDPRLDRQQLTALQERAREQADLLEELRVRTAKELFGRGAR